MPTPPTCTQCAREREASVNDAAKVRLAKNTNIQWTIRSHVSSFVALHCMQQFSQLKMKTCMNVCGAQLVWSCVAGVLLWEIFTGGDTPYPSFRQTDLIEVVCTKSLRLSQPERCPDAVFKVMFSCWAQVCCFHLLSVQRSTALLVTSC